MKAKFGCRICEFLEGESYSVRRNVPLAGVGPSHLRKVENDELKFDGVVGLTRFKKS